MGYQKEHGDTRVPQSYVDNSGYKLGQWVHNQRSRLPKMKVSVVREVRIEKLNSIQFEWEKPKMEFWDNMFELLLLYQKKHGNTRVPKSYVDSAGYKLGFWVNRQRST